MRTRLRGSAARTTSRSRRKEGGSLLPQHPGLQPLRDLDHVPGRVLPARPDHHRCGLEARLPDDPSAPVRDVRGAAGDRARGDAGTGRSR
ncbi:MAG: hypothetical protein KKA90_02560 [Nanoarchaeota archaeon]|nr:hypothetical protein [Nanoarchaeota archaeon]